MPTTRDYLTRRGHCIDAVFARYINQIESEVYVSYFTEHKPIISTIQIEQISDAVDDQNKNNCQDIFI